MATIKVLQKPTIINVLGSVIRIAHPDYTDFLSTQLSSPILAAGTTMSILDNGGFADDDWFVVGDIGGEKTEECDVNGAVTRGGTMTVTNTLKFDHEIQAPVTKVFERGIKLYGAATNGGAGTLITSIDAITTPIVDAYQIQWNKPYTEYTLISTDTAYAYYYAVFTDGVTSSSASDYVLATGISASCVENFIQDALDITDSRIDKTITRKMCVSWADDAQNAITQFSYQDPRTGELMQMDWDFEVVKDESSLTLTQNENSYSLSSLTYTPKYLNSDKGIINLRIGSKSALKKYNISDFDTLMTNKIKGTTSVIALVGDTTLTVTSNVEFADSGTIYLGSNTITYTAKSGTTGFTGIPASGTGSIVTQTASGSSIWQNSQPTVPTAYTVFNGSLLFNEPVSSDYVGFPIKLRYFKKLTALTESSDTTEVDFTNVFSTYIAAQIERRKGNMDKALQYEKEFKGQVLDNALKSKIPTTDSQCYYNFVPHGPSTYIKDSDESTVTYL